MNPFNTKDEFYDQTFEDLDFAAGQTLTGRFVDCIFSRCMFGETILRNCRFSGCIFQDCDLSLVQLPGSSFPSTSFRKSKMIGIDWTQANWTQAEFSNLTGFIDCVLSHSTFIGIQLKGIQLKKCIAIEVDFREAILSDVNFQGTDLTRSLFGSTNLSGADLSSARNYDIDPGNNNLKNARFALPEAMALLYSMDIQLQEEDDWGW